MDLVPPRLSVGTEVGFGPGREKNLSIGSSLTVGKSKWKWCGSAYYGSGRGILRSVTRAHELIVRGGPRNYASQMCAYSVKSVSLKGLVLLNDKVSGISLKSLGKGTVTRRLGCKVISGNEIISKSILGGDSSSSASGRRWEEEVNVWKSKSSNGDSSGTYKNEIHDITTLLVDVKLIGSSVHGSGNTVGSHWGGGETESGSSGEKGGGECEKLHVD
eukprot:720314_1